MLPFFIISFRSRDLFSSQGNAMLGTKAAKNITIEFVE
jgi:hypothetical protein